MQKMEDWAYTDLVDQIDTSSSVSSFPENRKRVIVSRPKHKFLIEVEDRLEHLQRLEFGWDGYKGEPVSFSNAYFALNIIEAVCIGGTPPPQIVPGTGGDLQIEWHTDAIEIELHILAPNKVEAWIRNSETGDDGKELPLTNNFIEVANNLRTIREHAFDIAAAA